MRALIDGAKFVEAGGNLLTAAFQVIRGLEADAHLLGDGDLLELATDALERRGKPRELGLLLLSTQFDLAAMRRSGQMELFDRPPGAGA